LLSLKFNPEITFLKTNNYFLLLMLYSARIIEQIINNNPMKDAMSNGCFVVNTTLPVIPLFIKNAPLINAIIAKDTVTDLDLNKFENFINKKFKFEDAKQFGANALFALESAILKAIAKSERKELRSLAGRLILSREMKLTPVF